MTELEHFRAQKNDFFQAHPQSPLLPDQQISFEGLIYFPENPALRLELPIERFAKPETVYFETTANTLAPYVKFGKIKFEVDEQHAELTIFRSAHGLFLPFVDALAGKETYPAGRYLEPEMLDDRTIFVDFNLAYNPYCAYNDQWTCPITPFENRLGVEIRAGEKMFHP